MLLKEYAKQNNYVYKDSLLMLQIMFHQFYQFKCCGKFQLMEGKLILRLLACIKVFLSGILGHQAGRRRAPIEISLTYFPKLLFFLNLTKD